MAVSDCSYDVLVCGGGIAGVAASLEAARAGMRTGLAEKSITLGGLATAGMVNCYLPLCDGDGNQVTFGIAEELLHLSLKYGPGDVPEAWRQAGDRRKSGRYAAMFSPAAFILALDEALENAGVDIWLDTLVTRPVMAVDRVTGVEVETKAGRGVLHASCVIDATGDADVAHRAGVESVEEANALSLWALEMSLEELGKAANQGKAEALLPMRCLHRDREQWKGIDPQSVTAFALSARRMLRARYVEEKLDRKAVFPLALPTMAQFRRTRRIVGRQTMVAGEDWQRRSDSVGLVADWRSSGKVWEVPYGTMVPTTVKGLLVVGRCISADGDAWEVTRVIPPCALTGQAAGVAATLAVRAATTPETLHVSAVQQCLRQRGIACHLEDIYQR